MQNLGRALVDRKLVEDHPPPPPSRVILLLAVPRRLFCFDSLVILCGAPLFIVILVRYKYIDR